IGERICIPSLQRRQERPTRLPDEESFTCPSASCHNSGSPQAKLCALSTLSKPFVHPLCDADIGGVPMQQPLDKAERLAQQADAQALVRRSFLQRAAGLAAVTAMSPAAFARNFGPSTEPQRYPDPDIIPLDKRFKYKLGKTPIHPLYTGTLWPGAR